jgi:hypothetical protein
MVKLIPALLFVVLLSACSVTSKVVPEGNDTYMVASHGTAGYSSGPAQRANALEKANDYCNQLGKQMEPLSEKDSGALVFGEVASG